MHRRGRLPSSFSGQQRTVRWITAAVACIIFIELLPTSERSIERTIGRSPVQRRTIKADVEIAAPPLPPPLASGSPHPVRQGVDVLSQLAKEASVAFKSGKLEASPQARQLTRWLKKGNQTVGWCNSKLADAHVCRAVQCLHSTSGARIDLTLKPFTILPSSSNLTCMDPKGGQLPHGEGGGPGGMRAMPEVSFIMTTHNNDALAAKALLELFRCSSEAI